MKPAVFGYEAPATLPQALALLAGPEPVAPLAGGQSLVPSLNLRRLRPGLVVDLNRLAGLDSIRIGGDAVRMGAMTRLRAVTNHPELKRALPILPETAALVATPLVRHRSTVGGCLCQADPGAELPALAVALDARLHLRSVRGDRVETAGDFFLDTGSTSRRADELLTDVEFPRHTGFRCCFQEINQRGQAGPPLVGLCMGVALDGPVVTGARLAATGVVGRPLRLERAEQALTGQRIDDNLGSVVRAADRDVAGRGGPSGDSGYRRALLRCLIGRSAVRLAATRRV